MRGSLIAGAAVLIAAGGWLAYVDNRPDYACAAINRYPGGEAELVRKLENPRGKTAARRTADADLARAFKEHPSTCN